MKQIRQVTCNGLYNPMGIDKNEVRFSWQIDTDQQNLFQKNYQILVWDEEGQKVWDSGKNLTDNSLHIAYQGAELKERSIYFYQVSVTDNGGETITSRKYSFETGIDKESFTGKWIGRQIPAEKDPGPAADADLGQILVDMMQGKEVDFQPDRKLEPCNIFERSFMVDKEKGIKRARIYMTARGIYELRVNQVTPDDSLFAPGFTKYEDYLEYQVYDVTELLYGGKNKISVVLADGWYKGKFGMLGLGENYGDELAFLLELEIVYQDGSRDRLGSDQEFQYKESPWRYADILIGEKYDARLEQTVQNWQTARIVSYSNHNLKAPCGEPVRPMQKLEPKEIITSPKGEAILDFGQNLVGVVELKVSGEAGTEIRLEHSEVLTKEGNFENFVDGFNRDQTDCYILKGDFQEIYRPKFTFHGFRYVKVSGYPGEVKPENFRAIVIGSDCRMTNWFQTSNPKLNQLQSNIMWSQRGNLFSIPTDCPQRERAGWTGDVWVYGETCCINQDCLNFFKKWLRNVRAEQFQNGLVPIVVPYIRAYESLQLKSFGTHTSAGWGDVIVALPWYLYQIYGDISVLEENYEAMERWMEYVRHEAENGVHLKENANQEAKERQKYLWNTNFHFGDWLYPSCKTKEGEADMFASANTTKEHVATAIYAHSAKTMAQICQVLGKEERSKYFGKLNGNIRKAFEEEYVEASGRIDNDIQGLYVMALALDLVSGEKKGLLAKRLEQLIQENGGCLDTGFMSIKFLMDVLTDNGLTETANTILYQEACPSWLYEVKKGATTIWETWNSIHEDDERGRFSYNHYAFGCIGDWMYRNLLGIKRLAPGYQKVLIAPNIEFGLTYAEGVFDSPFGKIQVKWRMTDKKKPELFVKVPANVTALVALPGEEVREIGNGTYYFR